MSQVSVTIAGRAYRMACAEGEEAHLEGLAAIYDGRIEEMRAAFGEIGDMRLHVMAAIAITDEFAETRRRVEVLERQIAELQGLASSGDERSQGVEARIAEGLAIAAERIERLARSLNPGAQPQSGS
jgi:cell division protein ZapA